MIVEFSFSVMLCATVFSCSLLCSVLNLKLSSTLMSSFLISSFFNFVLISSSVFFISTKKANLSVLVNCVTRPLVEGTTNNSVSPNSFILGCLPHATFFTRAKYVKTCLPLKQTIFGVYCPIFFRSSSPPYCNSEAVNSSEPLAINIY